jgi:fibronectin-binding autotransporter adhesin
MKKTASIAVPLLSALAGFLMPLALSAQTTITFEDGQPAYTDVRTTTVANPLTFTITDGAATQSGPIGGDGSLTKAGAGSITLTATNTYTGGTVINAGTLAVDHDGETTFGTLGGGTTTINGDNGSGLSGTLLFLANSSAGSGTFNVTGGVVRNGFGGAVEFHDTSTAGNATFTLDGATAGGFMIFLGSSTAGNATLIVNDSTNDGVAGSLFFVDDSLGGTATVKVYGKALLDIGFHNGGVTIGSLEGSGQVFLGANNLTVGGNNADTAFSGILDDFGLLGSLTKTGTGTLILSGTNTYTGGTTLSGGTLQLGDGGTAGSVSGDIANDGSLVFNRSDAVTYASVISGSGSLTQAGNGTLTLSGDNTYTGGTTINAGTLQLGDGGTTGIVIGNIVNNAALVFNRSDAVAYAGVVSGSGSLTQAGNGTLTLSGLNTYTGATRVTAGTLALAADNLLSPATTLTLTGGTLDLGGHAQTLAGLGSSSSGLVGNITTGAVTTAGDAYLRSGSYANTWSGTGRLLIGGNSSTTVTLNGTNDSVTAGHDQVIIGHSTTGAAGTVKLGNANALAAATENVHLWAGVLNLNGQANVRANSIVIESGDTSALVNLTNASTASFAGGVTLVSGTAQIGGVGNIALSGTVSGAGGFTKTSSGTLTLSAANHTYTGNTSILAGALVFSGTLASGDYHGTIANSGALTFSAPSASQTLAGVISGTGSLTKSGTGTLTLSAINTYTGNITIGGGTLRVTGTLGAGAYSGAIANSGALTFSAPTADQTLSGVISGTGSLTKSGTGTLTLTATNTYAGGTVLNGGTLGLGAGNALGSGLLTINGGNIRAVGNERTLTNDITLNGDFTLGRLTNLSGAIALTSDITLTSANPDSVEPVSSTLSGVISGAHSLTFTEGTNPVGTLILAGNNTYTGNTTVLAGNLLVTGTLGSGNYLGAISNSGTLTFSLSAGQIFAGAISNSGDLTFSSSAGLTLAGPISNSGALTLSSNVDQILSSVISGAGSFTKSGNGTLTLSGLNTYTGGTTLTAGVVTFSSLDSFGTGHISLAGGGLKWAAGNTADISSRLNPIPLSIAHGAIQATTFDTNGNNVSFASALSFADGSAVVKTGAGSLTLSGATGAAVEFDVVDGTLAFGAGAYQGYLYVGFSNYSPDAGYGPSAVLLSGPGTSFSSSETMLSSGNEFSASLTISGGASFSSPGYVYVGYGAIAESRIAVTGSGSTFTAAQYLSIGTFAYGRSTFIVSDGASATAQGTIVGDFSAGENLLTVSGTGSTFTTTGNLYIGSYSPNGQLITNSAAMTVSGGATASAGTTVIGRLGAISANSLTLTGTGSKFTNTGSLTLAASAADNGTLNLGSAAGNAATAAGILNAATVTGGLGAATLQFNTTGTNLAPTYFTRDGTSTGTGVNLTGGLSLVNTAGTTVLTGTGTQTGATLINGGTLVATQLANGGSASSIGQSTGDATNLVLNGGALRYTGGAQSTDRLFQIGGTTAGGTGTLDASGSGALNFTNTGGVAYGTPNQTRTLGLTGTNTGANTLAALIADNGTGAVSVAKSGAGTWVLSGANTYSGGTTISFGTVRTSHVSALGTGAVTVSGSTSILNLAGTMIPNAVTVQSGGSVQGSGGVGAFTIAGGGNVSPGNSPGTLTAGATTFGPGGSYTWQINDASPGGAGATTGWDLLSISGALNVTATSSSPFTLTLSSLTSGNLAGSVIDFNPLQNSSYTVATASGGIGGFNANQFVIDATGFSNATNGGTWSLVAVGNNLNLNFTASAIPEPSTYAALAGVCALGLAAWRKRRRR